MKITIRQTCRYISQGGDFDVTFRHKGKRYYFGPDIIAVTPEVLKKWIADEIKIDASNRAKIRRGTFSKNSTGLIGKWAKELTVEDCLAKNNSFITDWKSVKKCFDKGGKEFVIESDDPKELHIIPTIYLNCEKLTRAQIERTILRHLQEHFIQDPKIKFKVVWF
ncbi:MAG TPA: hypothetical protein P5096_02585 [Patescibacteria group bacterium]|nr:hypothetical protein [Patescibacteria group bacterium]